MLARTSVTALAIILAAQGALSQTTTAPSAGATGWAFGANALTYFVPTDVFVTPVFMADHGWLHLEARYNYEDFQTGSVWLGANFSTGRNLALDATALLGGVFGETSGIAPGWRLTLTYWKLELSSESEFVIDSHDSADNFFYNWSEVSIAPLDWIRAGAVVQRTKLYGEDRDVRRGLLLGFSGKTVNTTAYLFKPDSGEPTFVLAVGVDF